MAGTAARKVARPGAADARASTLAARWKLDGGVGFLIRLIEARYDALYQEFTAQAEITPRQFGVLLALYQNGPLTLTALARAISADRSTLGEMIRRMSDRKLVLRTENDEDARSFTISIAAQGRKSLLAVVEGAARLQEEFLAPVPRAQRAEFIHNLQRVARAAAAGE
ncbi:MAG: winged helix-turn-helix transcriptional regulator [Hyphomicrobiales bacterium]|nr:winged helix-turn-helix transcriptional regulator [Hyphomicrobiales bacterium]